MNFMMGLMIIKVNILLYSMNWNAGQGLSGPDLHGDNFMTVKTNYNSSDTVLKWVKGVNFLI